MDATVIDDTTRFYITRIEGGFECFYAFLDKWTEREVVVPTHHSAAFFDEYEDLRRAWEATVGTVIYHHDWDACLVALYKKWEGLTTR